MSETVQYRAKFTTECGYNLDVPYRLDTYSVTSRDL